MTQAMPAFAFLRPANLDEALSALAAQPKARLCAGGTDLIVNIRHGIGDPEALIDLRALPELSGITSDGGALTIGAGVTLRDLAQSDLPDGMAALKEAALAIAGPGHRAAATVGGNLCLDTRCHYYNQSHWWRKSNGFCLKYRGDTCHVAPTGNRCRAAFSGDLAPALMVLGAEVEIAGPTGLRRIALSDLYREDGAAHLTLAADEILTRVFVPAQKGQSGYAKVRIRGAVDFPLAGVAIACRSGDGGAQIFEVALTGTNSRPVTLEPMTRPTDDDGAFFTSLDKAVQKSVSPQRTSTTAAHYRRLSVAASAARLARALSDA